MKINHVSIFSWALTFIVVFAMITFAKSLSMSWDSGYLTGLLVPFVFQTRNFLIEYYG